MFDFLKRLKKRRSEDKTAVEDRHAEKSNDTDDFDGDTSNDITTLRAPEPGWKGIKRKYIYYVMLFLAAIIMYAVMTGFQDDKARQQERDAKKIEEVRDSKAVTGDHLVNIPKDYKEQAEADAKQQAEKEKRERREAESKRYAEKIDARQNNRNESVRYVPAAPSVPTRPQMPPTRKELSPAEKAKLTQAEERQKALVSPIGFDIKEEK